MPNLVELGPIFHSLRHIFPVRLILSGVLAEVDGKTSGVGDGGGTNLSV